MLNRVRYAAYEYPPQFWLLFGGSFINSTGASLIWPFITIYVRETFNVPLAMALSLFLLEAVAGFIATLIGGSLMDQLGRKRIMVLSLVMTGGSWLAMSQVGTFTLWAATVALRGMTRPMYRVGANAMVADLVPPDRRASAYALIRIIINLGVAIGPLLGGYILVGGAYTAAFLIATSVNWFFALLILIFARETMPDKRQTVLHEKSDASYLPVLRDLPFVAACFITMLAIMPGFITFSSIAVYTKEVYGIAEDLSSKLILTNGLMIVLTQLLVTEISKRYRTLSVLALGAFFYAVSTMGMAFSTEFWHFWVAMVVITLGEMVLVPTSTALVANMSPEDMRARYMSVYNVAFIIGRGVGPYAGGWLFDHIAPQAMWWGASVAGFAGMAGYLILRSVSANRRKTQAQIPA